MHILSDKKKQKIPVLLIFNKKNHVRKEMSTGNSHINITNTTNPFTSRDPNLPINILLRIVASMDTVQEINRYGYGREDAEPHIRRPVQRSQQEHVQEDRNRRHPGHRRHHPQVWFPRLRHHCPESLHHDDGGDHAHAEQQAPVEPRRCELPEEGESERHCREGGEEGQRG